MTKQNNKIPKRNDNIEASERGGTENLWQSFVFVNLQWPYTFHVMTSYTIYYSHIYLRMYLDIYNV